MYNNDTESMSPRSLGPTGNDIAYALETLVGCGFRIVAPEAFLDMRPIACAIFGLEIHDENFTMSVVENLAHAISSVLLEPSAPATFVRGEDGRWKPIILTLGAPWSEEYYENFYFARERERAALVSSGAIYLAQA